MRGTSMARCDSRSPRGMPRWAATRAGDAAARDSSCVLYRSAQSPGARTRCSSCCTRCSVCSSADRSARAPAALPPPAEHAAPPLSPDAAGQHAPPCWLVLPLAVGVPPLEAVRCDSTERVATRLPSIAAMHVVSARSRCRRPAFSASSRLNCFSFAPSTPSSSATCTVCCRLVTANPTLHRTPRRAAPNSERLILSTHLSAVVVAGHRVRDEKCWLATLLHGGPAPLRPQRVSGATLQTLQLA